MITSDLSLIYGIMMYITRGLISLFFLFPYFVNKISGFNALHNKASTLATVKTQIKYHHDNYDKHDLQRKKYIWKIITCDLSIFDMEHIKFIVTNQMEDSIST